MTRSLVGLIGLLVVFVPPALPAWALTITVDAGGNDYYQGDIDGATVFVGSIVVERTDTFAAVSLGRTNGQGVADVVADDGVDHQLLAEVYPQAVGNGCEFTYTTDGWASEDTVAMPYDSPAGNNDRFLGVLPGQVFGADTTVEFYVLCVGPTAQPGNDFEAYVPGAGINFFWEVQAAGPTCNDSDGDGYGSPGDPSCPNGGQTDCDDVDPAVNPGAPEDCDGVDDDCDGQVDEDFDQDADGWTTCAGDCDDGVPAVHPGAAEVCNGGVDDDCDGVADPADAGGCTTFFRDGDDDGFGVHADQQCLCAASDPYDALQGGDCDDADPARFPGNPEVCDGLDNDCDGALPGNETDADGDGAPVCAGDCDDGDATVFPLAPELCDQQDNDCDGVVDEDTGDDLDGDGFTACTGDCNEGDPAVFPGASEACNGTDDDCDGALPTDEQDGDGDGWMACEGDCDDGDAGANLDDGDGDGWSTCDGDCDDASAMVSPGAPEDCGDGLDNDCDGLVDGADGDCAGDDDDTTGDDDDDDTTGDDDTGDDDTGDDDTGDDDSTGDDDDLTPPGDDDTTDDPPADCACSAASTRPASVLFAALVLGFLVVRRRGTSADHLRLFLLPVAALGLSAVGAPGTAAASNCGLIEDADRRHLCYALADGSSSQCGLISDPDLRHYCYARVDRSSGQCGLISDSDLRHQCYGEVDGSSGQCGLISDSDRRHLCYARTDKSSGQCGLISDSDLRHYCYGVVDKNSGQCGLISAADLRRQCTSESK